MEDLVRRKTVFVAISGGVDSSVAALLLKKQGYEVIGVFMKNWSESIPGTLQCSTEDDQRYARQIASQLGIPFYTWDFEKEYRKLVFEPMISAYASGLTPNPDVACNQHIKFGLFLQKALSLGADYIATGHYVRLRQIFSIFNFQFSKSKAMEIGNWKLETALDRAKDQSYFLWTLTQNQLRHCLFPIGDYLKPEVRKIAKANGLVTAERKDSQGLCFVGKVDFSRFLSRHLPSRRGKIVAIKKNNQGQYLGEIIGTHNGLHFFTLGQRQGIGIGGGVPYYVVGKEMAKNLLYVADKVCAQPLFPSGVELGSVNLVSGKPMTKKQKVLVRYRYRQPLYRALIQPVLDQSLGVYLGENSFGVTPGQSMVFYQGETMLGGGVIEPFKQDWLSQIVI